MKSGWAVAIRNLGGKVPAWISKHTRKPGLVQPSGELDRANPTVSATNMAKGILHRDFQMMRKVNDAMHSRATAMKADLAAGHTRAKLKAGLK